LPAQKTPIKATTQEHLDVQDIRDDFVILKDGSCCLILTTNTVNFGLLSEPEQDATIFAYAGFVNSLTFPIQILIKSQRKDISSYLQLLNKAEEVQQKELLKNLIKRYRQFIEKVVRENDVLDKKFYIIIPFSFLELGLKSTVGQSFKRKKKLPFSIEYIVEKAKTSLYPKKDHLISQFSRLGLRARQLTNQELLDLFFQTYNPKAHGQKLSSVKAYQKSIVAPAVAENQSPADIQQTTNSKQQPTISNQQSTKNA